jgi:Transposase DDE domain group 1
MGETKQRALVARQQVVETLGLETSSGQLKVRWDGKAQATALGQMPFFIEFLTVTGLFDQWVKDCPLNYNSPNGSSRRDILGTWMLSILSGHWRYAHVSAIRADAVNPGLLGMSGVVAEDTLRRGLKAIDETAGSEWLKRHIGRTVLGLLDAPWILDVDVTIKPLYGKQQGAVVGYNPHKPGRPSHAYHSYQVSGLRLMLGVEVLAGTQSHAHYTLPGLIELLDSLPPHKRPKVVRGDAGLGVEPVLEALEERGQRYLFKLRLTANVKRYIEKLFFEQDWSEAAEGWEARDGELKLSGWSRARRVVVLRRAMRGEALLADESQGILAFIETDVAAKRYEYAVLVTNLNHELLTIAQLYRDRADSENAFDELKNQWGWGGYTTQDLARCRLSALAVALVYNWWSLFVRLGNPQARLEAITSRPFLLSAVVRQTTHGGAQYLNITSQHAKADKAKTLLGGIHDLLARLKASAEQLKTKSVWQLVCAHIIATVARYKPKIPQLLIPPTPGLAHLN